MSLQQIPIEGGWHKHTLNSAETDYQSVLRVAKAQHGGTNPYNPIGDNPMKPQQFYNPNFASVSTFDNRAPIAPTGSTGNYSPEYTSSTAIPSGTTYDNGMKANDSRVALALQGKSYFANLNNPVSRGNELYG